MSKINVGIIGMGYIGVSHIEAIRRIGFAQIVAVSDVNYELAKKKAEEYGIEKCYKSLDDMLNDSSIDTIHNCTPNNLHLEVNEKIIKAGKHVFSEKPLAQNTAQAAKLVELARKSSVINGVNFNYRMNPLTQEMKNKIKQGEIGKINFVHGSYLQDWLLYDTDYNWRIDSKICGPSRCVADIGSHWMDLAQTVTGAKITEVCADLVTVFPKRKKPKGQVETFSSNNSTEYEEVEVDTEDYGAIIFKMDNGIHGVFHTSEVSAGRKCRFDVEVNGTRASLYWNQEQADQMWMGFRDEDNRLIMRNPSLMTKAAAEYSYLAAGHPEGWNDAFKNNIYSFYKFISDGKQLGKDTCDFATFEDAYQIIKLTEAILESNETHSWVKV